MNKDNLYFYQLKYLFVREHLIHFCKVILYTRFHIFFYHEQKIDKYFIVIDFYPINPIDPINFQFGLTPSVPSTPSTFGSA